MKARGYIVLMLFIIVMVASVTYFLVRPTGSTASPIGSDAAQTATGCTVQDSIRRGTMDVDIIITGARYNAVTVDIIKPAVSRPLPVRNQYVKKFIDTGAIYIQQTYAYDEDWYHGVYHVVTELDGKSDTYPVPITDDGAHDIFVTCN